jgi:hypothetical protein
MKRLYIILPILLALLAWAPWMGEIEAIHSACRKDYIGKPYSEVECLAHTIRWVPFGRFVETMDKSVYVTTFLGISIRTK